MVDSIRLQVKRHSSLKGNNSAVYVQPSNIHHSFEVVVGVYCLLEMPYHADTDTSKIGVVDVLVQDHLLT